MDKETISLLREPLRWEFLGNEKEFESNVFENLTELVGVLGLPPIKIAERQRQIRFTGGQIIMDIVVRHIDGSATIFEVKKANAKHPATSPHAQMQAIGQLLLYQNIFELKTNVKPRLILIDNKIHERTWLAFRGNNLPITLIELQKDRVFVPYRAF